MSPKVDISGWPNAQQVCAALGISDATLERQVKADKWQTRLQPIPGRRPERRFDPDQLAARMPPPVTQVVKPQSTVPLNVRDTRELMRESEEVREQPSSDPMAFAGMAELAAAICERVLSALAPQAPQERTLFVDLDQAAKLTGLSKGLLRKLIVGGTIRCLKDRVGDRRLIMLRRADLESFQPE